MVNSLLKDIKSFKGTFPRDMLPRPKTFPFSAVCNLDTSTESGSHWVALYIGKDGIGYYMDSYGRPPITDDILTFLDTNCRNGWAYSPLILQSIDSSVCGYYAVLFIRIITNGIEYCDYLNIFNSDPFYNDQLVKLLVDSIDSTI